MTTTLAEADELVDFARRRKLKLVASPGTLLRPPTAQVRDVIQSGAIGRVFWALTGMQSPGHEGEVGRQGDDVLSNVDPTWYYKPGGGPVYDMAVYCFHELVDILGPVRRVSAMSGIALPERRWRDRPIAVERDDITVMSSTSAGRPSASCTAPTAVPGRDPLDGAGGRRCTARRTTAQVVLTRFRAAASVRSAGIPGGRRASRAARGCHERRPPRRRAVPEGRILGHTSSGLGGRPA
jgi:predicted dehydrogenase